MSQNIGSHQKLPILPPNVAKSANSHQPPLQMAEDASNQNFHFTFQKITIVAQIVANRRELQW